MQLFPPYRQTGKKLLDIFELEAWPERKLRAEPNLYPPLPLIRRYYWMGCDGNLLPMHSFFFPLTGLSSCSKMSDFKKVSLFNQGFKPRVYSNFLSLGSVRGSQQQKWTDLWKSLWWLSATCKAQKCHRDVQPGQNPGGQQLVALQPSCMFTMMLAAGEMLLADCF